ncbi:hypothetical protein [Clostridium beijerinckii]|uniref:hypothetical protein n=1 Tax=Clostridium beijerinckii TaxID=1520 RepID=UPI00156EF096|nr:hypothetical protein [Clostridium beijerinckii]NRU52390.1 hypothetical protein [Clostridium beijerinckii]NRU52690.1 hypothetical protein [Clostridium beijerinckii]NYC68732.1 hypothetical protein [Clostridium beijerinckii]NYC91881.1 hypothetical protein [Clostridium beijerinckii]
MIKIEQKRIEMPVTIASDHEVSEKYPNQGNQYCFKDDEGISYYYDTMTELEVYTGQRWLIRMTIVGEDEFKYKIVQRIKLIEKLENETLEEQCKRMLGIKRLDNYYDSYEEAIRDSDERYIIHKGNVYEVIEDRECCGDDIFEAKENSDGTISYVLSYYNGGCGYTEAIGESLNRLKVNN